MQKGELKMSKPKVPYTRKEQYLAKISGDDVKTPEKPITREEMYLNAIATTLFDKVCTKEEFEKKIAEVEGKIGETFTSEEKSKLESITNPINVKGIVNSDEELQTKKNRCKSRRFVVCKRRK